MKRKPNMASHVSVPHCRLYLEDLEEIVQMLAEGDLPVVISDHDYEYDSLSEFAERKGPSPGEFEIQRGYPTSGTLSIRFSIQCVTLFAMWGGADIALLSHQVRSFLQGKCKWHLRFFNPTVWGGVFFSVLGFCTLGRLFDMFRLLPRAEPYIWAACAFFLVFFFVSLAWQKSYGGVLLLSRSRVQGFWKRNGDRVFLLIIGAVLGALAKWLLDALSK